MASAAFSPAMISRYTLVGFNYLDSGYNFNPEEFENFVTTLSSTQNATKVVFTNIALAYTGIETTSSISSMSEIHHNLSLCRIKQPLTADQLLSIMRFEPKRDWDAWCQHIKVIEQSAIQ